ncbi:universal stress protein [Actinomadura barringtoniae]|uniref:Universal stress protein n=1 Tax=Actinomadura barringtoniae TaxID=1427535 RepID=A0A939P8X8_9ACTN|nr:universal stress protein [Actinomadura barringtoniae]MBO2447943.1 universal stress protein [Actinomadura barringtoniae]
MNADSNRPILVGYDASFPSDRALRWAVDEARLRERPLLVCHAWNWPYPFRQQDAQALEIVHGMGQAVVEAGVRRAHELADGLDVRPLLKRGTAPAALLGAARDAELIVLGTRGTGGFDDLRVGSAAAQVPAHADRPVIVVPPGELAPRRDGVRIVAGVDGSPASEAALDFAFAEAELRDLPVTAVCAWWDPSAMSGPDNVPFTDPEALKSNVKGKFEQAVSRAKDKHPKVSAETRFVMRKPQQALTDIARGATLLVVGNRGLGAAPQELLGAVTRTVLHNTPCPMTIVPEHHG